MTTPKVGLTHDIVIYDGAGNISPVGLVAGFSYQVVQAPSFVPRMAIGDPKGTDLEPWISWVRDDFRGGSGRYAELPTQLTRNQFYKSSWVKPRREDGALEMYYVPQAYSFEDLEALITSGKPWFYFGEVSGNEEYPDSRIIANQYVWWLPEVTGAYDRAVGIILYSAWIPSPVVSACVYSGCIALACESGQIKMYRDTGTWNLMCMTAAGVVQSYDNRLWRSVPNRPEIAYWQDGEWSSIFAVGEVGAVLAMEPFIGRLFVAKEDGIWLWESGRTYRAIDLAGYEATADECFGLFKSAHGALYWNLGRRIFRYTSGGLLEELATPLDGAAVSAAVTREGLVIATENCMWLLDAQLGCLVSILDKEDVSFSDAPAHKVVGVRGDGIFLAPTKFLFHSLASEASYFAPQTSFSLGFESSQAIPTVNVELPFVDLGYPQLKKGWRRGRVWLPNDFDFNDFFTGLRMQYRVSGADTYTDLGSVSVLDEGYATWALPSASRRMQVKIVAECSTAALLADTSPLLPIQSVEIDGHAIRGGGRIRVHVLAQVTDQLRLLNGEIENSAAWVAESLFSLTLGGLTHVVALPYPPPAGHTINAQIELSPSGAVVPIMAYTSPPSRVPGAAIGLVITEV